MENIDWLSASETSSGYDRLIPLPVRVLVLPVRCPNFRKGAVGTVVHEADATRRSAHQVQVEVVRATVSGLLPAGKVASE